MQMAYIYINGRKPKSSSDATIRNLAQRNYIPYDVGVKSVTVFYVVYCLPENYPRSRTKKIETYFPLISVASMEVEIYNNQPF